VTTKSKRKPKKIVVQIVHLSSAQTQTLQAALPYLRKDLAWCQRMHDEIDRAFEGKPFFFDLSPLAPENGQRFRAYWDMRSSVTKMVIRLSHESMRIHGIDPNHPDQVWLTHETELQPASSDKTQPAVSAPLLDHFERKRSERNSEMRRLEDRLRIYSQDYANATETAGDKSGDKTQ
jgi:hypothetical protein